MPQQKTYNKVHFIGVAGVGLSRIAKYFLLQKKQVSGSDLVENEFTRQLVKAGLDFHLGHKATNLPADCDLTVHSIAIPKNNPELLEAQARGVEILTHFEVLGEISEAFKTIAIAGTNGKSTTTAMIGLILEEAGLDPTVFVGSAVAEWRGNLRVGRGAYLVVEADELQRQFLSLRPFALAITNIEADHLDYYKDLNDELSAFRELCAKLPPKGFLAYNKDDAGSAAVGEFIKATRIISYGKNTGSVRLRSISVSNQKQSVEISIRGKRERFGLLIPGTFNVYNALAAIAVATDLHVPFAVIKQALEKFRGIWRRFQILGTFGRTLIISDYGHHPTALLETVLAAKDFYPGKKILLVFQPHQFQRTKFFYKQFVESILQADPAGLILCEVYDVAGRDSGFKREVTSTDLMIEVSKHLSEVEYAGTVARAEQLLRQNLSDYDIAIVMGAGDIYHIAENLFKKVLQTNV